MDEILCAGAVGAEVEVDDVLREGCKNYSEDRSKSNLKSEDAEGRF